MNLNEIVCHWHRYIEFRKILVVFLVLVLLKKQQTARNKTWSTSHVERKPSINNFTRAIEARLQLNRRARLKLLPWNRKLAWLSHCCSQSILFTKRTDQPTLPVSRVDSIIFSFSRSPRYELKSRGFFVFVFGNNKNRIYMSCYVILLRISFDPE